MNYKKKAITGAIGFALIAVFSSFVYMAVTMISMNICELHGFTVAEFSLFFSAYGAGTIVSNYMLGLLMKKLGLKKLARFGILPSIISTIVLILADNIILLSIGAFIIGFFVGLVSIATYSVFVGAWFNRGRGMMISLLGGVTSIANMIFAPVMANVIETSGTVTAVLGLGIVLTVVTIIGNFMVCNLPSVYGAEMVDITKEKKSKSAKDDSQAAETQEKPYDIQMPASKLLRHPATIIALLIPFLGIVGTLLYMNYHVYVYESMGLDYTTAALFVSIASGATIIFSPLFGIACDKLGIKAGIIIFSGTVGITRILSPILGGYAGAIIFALFNGMSSYAFYVGGIVFPELFGQKNNATLNGWFGALSGLSSIVAAPLAVQLIAAANQSYDLVIYVSGALFLLSIVGIIYLMSDSTKKSLIKMDQKYLQKINNQ